MQHLIRSDKRGSTTLITLCIRPKHITDTYLLYIYRRHRGVRHAYLPLRVEASNLRRQLIHTGLIHSNESLRTATKVVDVSRVDVEPERVYVQIVRL